MTKRDIMINLVKGLIDCEYEEYVGGDQRKLIFQYDPISDYMDSKSVLHIIKKRLPCKVLNSHALSSVLPPPFFIIIKI